MKISLRNLDANGLLLFGIVSLLACGVSVGESLQPSRLLVLASIVALLPLRRLRVSRQVAELIGLGCVWVLWGILSLLWTPDFHAGFIQVIGIALGIITAAVVSILAANTRAGWDAIRRGWIVAFLATVPVAFWEIFTNHHLATSYGSVESGGLDSFTLQYAAVTFGNRNMYAAFLCLVNPVILCSFASSRSSRSRAWHLTLAFLAALLIIVDASRLGMVALVLQWAVFFWIDRNRGLAQKILFLMVPILLLGFGLYGQGGLFRYTVERLGSALSGTDESGELRMNLILNGIDLIERSHYLGVGAGGFSRSMLAANTPYGVGGLTDSHNVWIEVAANYGLLVLIAIVSWLGYQWLRIRRMLARARRLPSTGRSEASYGYALILIPSLVPIGAMNSSTLTYTVLWVAVGSIVSTGVERLASRSADLDFVPGVGDVHFQPRRGM